MLSHSGDGAAESCWRWRYRVLLVMALSSPAGNSAADATWPRCDVDAESCL
jgi:hypothetical protein